MVIQVKQLDVALLLLRKLLYAIVIHGWRKKKFVTGREYEGDLF